MKKTVIISELSQIGQNFSIGNFSTIGDEVVVSDGVSISSGVHIGNRVTLSDNVVVGTNSVLISCSGNVKTNIDKNVVIESNCTIAEGICIGRNAIIRNGSVVDYDIPPYSIVCGNPAKIVGYVDAPDPLTQQNIIEGALHHQSLEVGDCYLVPLPCFGDIRGSLMVNEFESHLPFIPKRCFFVYNVPSDKVRGEHAHKECKQFLVALSGTIHVVLDDGKRRKEVVLKSPSVGLYLSEKVWGIQYKFTENAILCVYASHNYDESDYLREYDDFLKFIKV